MSQTEKNSPKLYQALCVVLIITTIGGLAGTAYYYGQWATANAKANDFAVENAKLKSQIDSLNAQVSQLQGQVTTLQAQASANQAMIAQLQAKIDGLNAQIALLQAQLAALPKVDWVTGVAKIGAKCPLLETCEAVAIEFMDASTGTIYSSTVKTSVYGVWLLDSAPYSPITIYFTTSFLGILTGIDSCSAIPPTFTPTTNPASQPFFC